MKRHGYLFERVVDLQNIHLAVKKSFRGKRFNKMVVEFYFNLENEVLKIQEELMDESYHPMSYKIFRIYEPKERRICCSEFYDRVVHNAIINVLGPIFERRLISLCREIQNPLLEGVLRFSLILYALSSTL